jgi:hypothetical protein
VGLPHDAQAGARDGAVEGESHVGLVQGISLCYGDSIIA